MKIGIHVDRHVIMPANAPPTTFDVHVSAPGVVELVAVHDGVRMKIQISGPDAVQFGASILLTAGASMNVAPSPGSPLVKPNGAAGGQG